MVRTMYFLTDEVPDPQPSHDSDREHDLLKWVAFVSMKLGFPIIWGEPEVCTENQNPIPSPASL